MLGVKPAPVKVLSPEESLVEEMRARHGERLHHAESRAGRLLIILDADAEGIAAEGARLSTGEAAVEILDPATWNTLQRLAASGLMSFAAPPGRVLHSALAAE